MGVVDVCSVLLTRVENSGVNGGGVAGKCTQPSKTQREIQVQTLEVQNRDSKEGTYATPAVQPMRYALGVG